MPRRLQRRRTKGWKTPGGAIYVGRPTVFGNPFQVGPVLTTREEAVDLYRWWLDHTEPGQDVWLRARRDLRGRDLLCWCPASSVCHADVLLEIANS